MRQITHNVMFDILRWQSQYAVLPEAALERADGVRIDVRVVRARNSGLAPPRRLAGWEQ